MWICHEKGCTARPTHKIRLIAEKTGEVLKLDFCTPHADAMNAYIKREVPGATSSCPGTIRVDKNGNQINEGMVH